MPRERCPKTNKVRFVSERDARTRLRRSKTISARIRIYRCEFCKGYHFTKQAES